MNVFLVTKFIILCTYLIYLSYLSTFIKYFGNVKPKMILIAIVLTLFVMSLFVVG